MLTLCALPPVLIFRHGLQMIPAVFMALPVIAASVVLRRHDLVTTALLTLAFALLIALTRATALETLSYLIAPAVVIGALTAALIYKDAYNGALVAWALDWQRKDAKRAEDFFAQTERLAEALLHVQWANARLAQMNAELDEARRAAAQASQAKSVFLSNMSHELRTPLNVIIGYAGAMQSSPHMFNNQPLPAPYLPTVRLMEESGHYLLGLINDVLDLSKIEAGKLEIHPTVVALPEVLRGILTTSIALVKDKPVQLRPDFPDRLPLAWADPIRVRQILLNLVSNAIKFTASGSVTLTAHVQGERIRIAVTDTGAGIPAEALASIFDRFQQADKDTTRRYGGTGLGLDIARQLAQMHGGDLTVESAVNQGSTFAFTLAMAAPEQIDSSPRRPMSEQAMHIFETAAEPVEARSVLLVADDAALREGIRRVIEAAGLIVIESHEAGQAVSLAAGLLPDVVLLDERLADVWDALQLNDTTNRIPVLLLTGEMPAPELLLREIDAAAMPVLS